MEYVPAFDREYVQLIDLVLIPVLMEYVTGFDWEYVQLIDLVLIPVLMEYVAISSKLRIV